MSYLGDLGRAVIGRAAKRPAASAGASYDLANMSDEQVREFIRIGGGMQTASGAVVTESSAMRVAAAWRCVNIISGAIAGLPSDLIRRVSETEREPAVGHPLRRVLTVKPNHWQTPGEFKRMMTAQLQLRGNAYALKVLLGGQVQALIPLHPDRVVAEQADDNSMLYRVAERGGRQRVLGQPDIFHMRGMSLDGVTGLSVMSHMRESLGLSLSAERAGAKLMERGQFVGGTLKHPGQLSAEAYERLKASTQEAYGGADNAGKMMILEEGMDFGSPSMSAVDLQFLEQRNFQRYDIAMFFGVPPHMLGATEKTTSWGSGIEQQGIGFVTYTLNDWIRIWEESIKRDLIPEREWDRIDARFFTQGLMRGDAKARWETYGKALQWGVYSPNEVRALEDMNPREGGGIYYPPPNTAGDPDTEDKSTHGEPDEPEED
ncbi:phage portal protein [Pikeienuella sp. HZG-20]|uniref:phage portal protein n=1 Tax=Paludibacillus litoralis TaxID=3133267 RepID=UPI0030EB4AC0